MIIQKVAAGETVTFSLRNGVLRFEDQVEIDLAARQGDVDRTIDVCLDNSLETMREGLGAWYVATIIVPARQQEYVETDEGGEVVDLPLDMKKVVLNLWPLPQVYLERKQAAQEVEQPETQNEVVEVAE
ncbi:AAA family ATPase [Exiguobacterium antarcticum]|uniref:AAA family ATPase n=1 Tax=Exiguobacterium antarcticum TaxID=132920 RepID=A0ABT6QZZ4_9BACL|nr:AAA family ATPase [Exiguobacterium antarcticum]MDI3234163.1 AAA family ATPase [Exiguobacterium antarcticum]